MHACRYGADRSRYMEDEAWRQAKSHAPRTARRHRQPQTPFPTYPASPPPCGTPLSPMRARRKRVTVGKLPLVLYDYKRGGREGMSHHLTQQRLTP